MGDPSGLSQSPTAPSPSPSYTYPYATSPDIIRSHQKDAYFSNVLLEQLSTLLRKLYGARALHTNADAVRTSADLLYLALTTLLGNRTLGEEYCDIVQVEGRTASRLPRLSLRAGFIALHVLLPYGLNRVLPKLRRRLRSTLEARLRRKPHAKLQSYALAHIDTLTSPAPLYALSLATFYFSGAYYHLAKRALNLRYIFTRQLNETEQRAGYEVLGVLLVLQLAVQSYFHVHDTVRAATQEPARATAAVVPGSGAEVPLSLDPAVYSANNALLYSSTPSASSTSKLAQLTHTPPAAESPRVDLADPEAMKWLGAGAGRGGTRAFQQARKCTLCLEAMKDPAATVCGHVFCWRCIQGWCAEKRECPLCRQQVGGEHVLVLRG